MVEVKIITNPMCGKCKTVKMILQKRGVEYKEIQDIPPKLGGVYPIIQYDGKELSFGEFLQEIKK